MGMGLFVLRKDIAERLGRLVGGLGIRTGSPVLIQDAWVGHETLLLYCGIIPTGISHVPASPLLRWFRLIRPQDFVWLLLFAVLAVTTAEIGDVFEIVPLAALARGAGAGAQDPGARFHAQPDLLDRAEAGCWDTC